MLQLIGLRVAKNGLYKYKVSCMINPCLKFKACMECCMMLRTLINHVSFLCQGPEGKLYLNWEHFDQNWRNGNKKSSSLSWDFAIHNYRN